MEQSYKKRPPRATTFCTPVLLDMGKLLYKSAKFKAQTGGGGYYARKNTTQIKIQTSKTHFPCFLNANTCVNQKNIIALHCQLEIKTLAKGPES